MRIGLFRHGVAEDIARSDFDRRLTPGGRAEVVRVGELLYRAGYRPGCILHSPLIRAEQTAAALHERFPEVANTEFEALAYGNLDDILRQIAGMTDPLLVGHEPTLGLLVARLIGAPSGSTQVERSGFALVDVDRIPTTRPAMLRAFVHPAMAPP